ncbi:hypothetical protein B0H19DRAFT_398575 [Mycena capillaripes]|nr:hypothetical protein B0H19DRAFT_398575 [Mycena capillaripes]
MLDGLQSLDRPASMYQPGIEVSSCAADLILTTINPGRSLDSFFSRLNASQPPPSIEIWAKLFDHLHSSGSKLSATKYAGLVKAMQACITSTARNAPAFPLSNDWKGESASVDPIFSMVEICVRFAVVDSLAIVFSSMRQSKDQHTSQHPRAPASAYYKALTPKLGSLISGKPTLHKHLYAFFDQALELLLSAAGDDPELFKIIIQYSAKSLQAANLVCTPERINELSKSKKYDFLRSLSEFFAFSPQLRQDASKETLSVLQTITEKCFIGMVNSIDYSKSSFSWRPLHTIALDDIHFAFSARMPALGAHVLNHLLNSPEALDLVFICSVLSGVLRGLPDILAAQKLSIAEQPYRDFAAKAVKEFTRIVLGPKPATSVSLDDLKTIGCGCHLCGRHLFRFFASPQHWEYVKEK